MHGFNVSEFERTMSAAGNLHAKGDIEDALRTTMRAYRMAPDDSLEAGRAARDIGARYDALGALDEAGNWSEKAFHIHDSIVIGMDEPSRSALRERSVSALYVGINGLRKQLSEPRAGHSGQPDRSPVLHMRQAWTDIQRSKSLASGSQQSIDQYEINAVRRISVAETMLGDRKTGLLLGTHAVRLAFWSESPRIDTSNPALSTPERLRAKWNALRGGAGALAVSLLYSGKSRYGRSLAKAIAGKIL